MLCFGLLAVAAATTPGAGAKSKEPEPAAAATPNPQPPPATETEAATTGKNGPRPLMGLTPRPGASAELPKPPRDPAERRAWLDAQLDAVFKTPALARAKVSAIVVEADSGKTLYAHDDKTPLNAASNVKIVTSAASLSLLGPEYRWRTTLAVVGPPGGPPLPAGGEVSGDLYLRGSGDPTLSTEDLAAMVSDPDVARPAQGQRVAGDRRQPVRWRLPTAGLRSEDRLDRLARTFVGGVARRQRRRRHHHPRRRGRRAGPHRRRSGVALLHRRGARRHRRQRPGVAERRHQRGGQPDARQRRRADQAGRRSAHVLPAGRPALAVSRADAEAALRAARHLRRQCARRRGAHPGAARDRHRTTRRRWQSWSRISTSAPTTSPPSSCSARSAPRSAGILETGTRASRPSPATSAASGSRPTAIR